MHGASRASTTTKDVMQSDAMQTEEGKDPEEGDEDAPSPEGEEIVSSDILLEACCGNLGILKSTLRRANLGQLANIKKLFGFYEFLAEDCIQIAFNIILPVPNPKPSGIRSNSDLQRKFDKAQLAS